MITNQIVTPSMGEESTQKPRLGMNTCLELDIIYDIVPILVFGVYEHGISDHVHSCLSTLGASSGPPGLNHIGPDSSDLLA